MTRLIKLIANQSDHMKEVFSGAMVSFVIRMMGAIAQFGFTILLARMFGAEGYGTYALALSLVVISATIGRWGMDQAALKYISIYAVDGNYNAVKNIFINTLLLVVVMSGLISCMLFLLASWVSETFFNSPLLAVLIHLMAISIVPLSLLTLISECLRAMKKMAYFTMVQVFLLPMVSILFLFQFKAMGMDLRAAAYAFVFASIVSFAIASLLWYWSIVSLRNKEHRGGIVSFEKLMNTANPMAWVLIVSVIMSFSETLILGYFYSSKEVGFYAVSLRLALIVNFVIIAFNSILAPKFSKLYHDEDFAQVKSLMKNSIIAMLVLTSPAFILFFIFPEYALSLFGSEFSSEPDTLRVLALGQLVNIFSGPLGMMLLMTGHEKQMQKNMFVYSFAGIFFGFILIPFFGMQGAAWSLTLGLVVLGYLSIRSVRNIFSH